MPSLGHSLSSLRRAGSDAVALGALVLVIVVAPELLGGVYPWGMFTLASAALVALALTLWRDPMRGVRWSPLVILMLASLAWTCLQAVPLPCGLVEHLAPVSVAELRRAHQLLGAPAPAWCVLSRDPGATRAEVVKGIAINATFLSAFMLSRRGHGRLIYGAIVATGVLIALVACAHVALGATRVFGVYAPVDIYNPLFLAPLMNLNTLGGLLAMCVPISVGLAFAEYTTRARLTWLLTTGLLAGCAFMTRSRGAVGALFLGLALLALLAWGKRSALSSRVRSGVNRRRDAIALSLGVVVALGIGAYGWYSEVAAEFRGGALDKFDLIGLALKLATQHPWIGVGRGAFGSVFASVHDTTNRFEYAENFVAQWASEWGFPMTLLLLAALAHALVRSVRRARSVERLGAIAGVSAFAAQNLVDLGLELVGIAVVAAALLGAATAHAQRARRDADTATARSRLVPMGVVAAVAGLLALLAYPVSRDHGAYLQQRLKNKLAVRDRSGFRAALGTGVRAHPSAPVYAVMAASEALLHHDPAVGKWINRSMQLVPGWSSPHLLAVQWLWNSGRHQQALLELGAAMRRDPYGARSIECQIAKVEPGAVLHAIPHVANRHLLLELAAGCIDPNSGGAPQFDEAILAEFPGDAHALLRAARRALVNGDAEEANETATQAMRHDPKLTVEASVLRARALRALEQFDDAIRVLQHAEKVDPTALALVTQEAQLEAERGDANAMRAAVMRLRGLASESATQMAGSFMLEGSLEHKLGNRVEALRAYDHAYGITGETSALSGIASIALELGDRRRAVWAYGMLCELPKPDRNACTRRDQLTSATRAELPAKAAQPSQR